MRWVVLSDLHLTFKNCTTSTAREHLLETLEKEKSQYGNFSFILFTGDCMYQHTSKIETDTKYFKQIATACGVPTKNIILCAGNHDVDRNNTVRINEIKNIRNSGQLSNINNLKPGYGEFDTLHKAVTGRFYKHFDLKIVEDCRIITIDSSLLSLDDNDIGKLGVSFQELHELGKQIKSDEKYNIVIMHHGINWLMPKDAKNFQHWLAEKKVDIVFCGHSHNVGLDILTEAIPKNSNPLRGIKQFTCGAGLYDQQITPSFYIGEINNHNLLKLTLYTYQNDNRWEVGQGVLRSFPNGYYECNLKQNMTKNTEKDAIPYDTIFDADSDIADELKKSPFLDFFGMRGNTFQIENSKTSSVLHDKTKDIYCRILVSYPYCDRIEDRLKMVPEFAPREKLEQRWKEIFEDIGRLKKSITPLPNGHIRFHEQPLLYRFIITDKSLYYGFYEEKKSSESMMWRYDSDTQMYRNYKYFFDNLWNQSKSNYPTRIPQKYSFLEDKFDMMPSLVINLTDDCNMNCKYCPEGGENLQRIKDLCDISRIKWLMTGFMNYCKKQNWNEKKVLRITGGEPLLEEIKLKEIFRHALNQNYQKIVLCTNGILLQDVYFKAKETWESVKDIILLKISLDSLKKNVFGYLTQTNGEILDTVINNIKFAKEKGFKIELNLVATKKNVEEVEDIYNFATELGLIGVKVLTVNDFGGLIEQDDVSNELEQLMERMRNKGYHELDLYVHNNKGILMKRFQNNNCTLTIVDHMNKATSITPRRTYSQACQKCNFYPESAQVKSGLNKPCATGIMSLTMRADGILSFCRLKTSEKSTIKNAKSKNSVQKIVDEQMENFRKCYHYNSPLKEEQNETI
jgi:Molybdenum cofactor biosynthesis enzyme